MEAICSSEMLDTHTRLHTVTAQKSTTLIFTISGSPNVDVYHTSFWNNENSIFLVMNFEVHAVGVEVCLNKG
jgi:hypothetical protein